MNVNNYLSIFERFANPYWSYKIHPSSPIGKLLRLYQDSLHEMFLGYVEGLDEGMFRKYQLKRLILLIEKARKLPFYRDIFTKLDITPENFNLSDLSKLPVIHKKDLRSHQESEYIDFSVDGSRGSRSRTSGSTGEPFYFLEDRRYRAQIRAFYYQTFRWLNISLKTKKVNFIVPWGSRRAWGNPEADYYLSVGNFQNNLKKYTEFLERFKPLILESNPSFLVYFAHYLVNKRKKLRIPYLVSYGEQLSIQERQFLQQVFSTEVTSYYGLSEFGTVGVECSSHDDFHINTLSYFVEIVDEKGKLLDEEKEGEIVLTSFVNDIMPLMRYGTGDRGKWIKKPCACGRTLPKLHITGRRDDFLRFENGRVIYMNFFHPIFYKKIKKIRQFQIVQETPKKVTVRLVPVVKLTVSDKEDILADIKDLLGPGIIAKISEEEEIPWQKSGKYKSVIKL